MWSALTDASNNIGGGSDNLYSLLIAMVSGLALMAGGVLRWRGRRRGSDPEPTARHVVGSVETYLQKRVRQVEREKVELERQLNDERAKTLSMTETIATLRAERSEIIARRLEARHARPEGDEQ